LSAYIASSEAKASARRRILAERRQRRNLYVEKSASYTAKVYCYLTRG
jgi:hypothetical protein